MRASILLLFVVGCAVDPSSPTITITHTHDEQPTTNVVIREQDPQAAVCAYAAQLPSDDICSLMCDPDAMAAELVTEGDPDGRCYDFACPLPDGSRALVGVCLPPS